MTTVNKVDIIELDLGARHTPFNEALELQRTIHSEVAAGTRNPTIILVEHEPVYTAGVRTRSHELPAGGLNAVPVDRGGKVTWHGPGQLVAYPIVPLNTPLNVVEYVRTLELAVIETCLDFELTTLQIPGRSGVWVPPGSESPFPHAAAKVCAIGARVAQNVTLHGLALNCSNSLEPFKAIIPCGITDAGVTSLSEATNSTITPLTARAALTHHLVEKFKELGIQ